MPAERAAELRTYLVGRGHPPEPHAGVDPDQLADAVAGAGLSVDSLDRAAGTARFAGPRSATPSWWPSGDPVDGQNGCAQRRSVIVTGVGGVDGRSRYVDYGRVADRYRHGRALSPAVLARWGKAVGTHPPPGPLRVVDVGAGTGIFAAAWPQWAPASVVAVEPNEAMIRAGHPGVRYVRAVAEALPLASGSVDVVWVSTAVHHFADLPRALGECARVLREAGCVLIRTFLPGRTEVTWLGAFPGRDKALARFLDVDGLAAAFARHGLRVSHVGEVFEEVWSFGESADWIARMRHADSMLTALSDDEVAAGLRALRAEPTRQARNELSLVVLRRA